MANFSSDNIGKHAHLELVGFREIDGAYAVTLNVSGNGYKGTAEMMFTLDGETISRLVIEPELSGLSDQ